RPLYKHALSFLSTAGGQILGELRPQSIFLRFPPFTPSTIQSKCTRFSWISKQYEDRKEMSNKAVLGALSAVLLVAAVIGAASDDSPVASSKSVTAICASTDYADVCERTLNAAINGSASQGDHPSFFMVAIKEIEAATHLSNNVSLKATDSMNKDGFDICRRLFEDATEELQAAFSETHDLDGLARRTDDIKCWLSAVISYQQTCLDSITQPDLHSTMKDGLVTASQ
ncbi:unnamed protein product, partial [Musa acuminata subsp. burmannicoides]